MPENLATLTLPPSGQNHATLTPPLRENRKSGQGVGKWLKKPWSELLSDNQESFDSVRINSGLVKNGCDQIVRGLGWTEVVRGSVEFGLDRVKARQRWSNMVGSGQFDFHKFLDYQSVHRCLYMSRYGKAKRYGQIPYAMGWSWTCKASMIQTKSKSWPCELNLKHCASETLEMEKNFSSVLIAAMRMPLLRALK